MVSISVSISVSVGGTKLVKGFNLNSDPIIRNKKEEISKKKMINFEETRAMIREDEPVPPTSFINGITMRVLPMRYR